MEINSALAEFISRPSELQCQHALRGSAPGPREPREACWLTSSFFFFFFSYLRFTRISSEGESNNGDLTLEMGCNLSSPRALCLIQLIRERKRRVSPLCVFSVNTLSYSPAHFPAYSLHQLPD